MSQKPSDGSRPDRSSRPRGLPDWLRVRVSMRAERSKGAFGRPSVTVWPPDADRRPDPPAENDDAHPARPHEGSPEPLPKWLGGEEQTSAAPRRARTAPPVAGPGRDPGVPEWLGPVGPRQSPALDRRAPERGPEQPPPEHQRARFRLARAEIPAWMRQLIAARSRRSPVETVEERPSRLREPVFLLVTAMVLVVLLLSGWLARFLPTEEGSGAPSDAGSNAPASQPSDEPVSEVADQLLPSVVQIETNEGLGSGLIYERGGLILTAAHVLRDAGRVAVRLESGRRVEGRVVGTDRSTDVGVVRVRSGNLPEAELELNDPPEVGDLAVAIGSPFGLEGSVTAGVVSAVDRTVLAGASAPMIQTDAPINPGNSGGALANRDGRVIGINDAITSTSGTNAGVGFAIPIETAKRVADALVAGNRPRIGFLGVMGTQSTSGRPGALVTQVLPNTAADAAGLRPGDVIVAVDGRRIEDMNELAAEIRSTKPGQRVVLEIIRSGKRINVRARIGIR